MDKYQLLTMIAAFVISGVLVMTAGYLIAKKFFENEERKRFYEFKANNYRITLPIRLQAYERLTLLLERMSINNLILRVKQHGMTATDLQVALLAEIRAEFDHNLSQQVYISGEAWQFIVNAKENTVKLVNLSYSKLPSGASSLDLSKTIFENAIGQEIQPSYAALKYLKTEARELF
jgi:hypothetical protein